MARDVKIPTQLRSLTGNEAETEVEGASVGEALDALYERYDGLRDRITEDGELRRFVNVYVGGEDIRFGQGLETPVERRRRDHDPAGRRRRLLSARSARSASRPGSSPRRSRRRWRRRRTAPSRRRSRCRSARWRFRPPCSRSAGCRAVMRRRLPQPGLDAAVLGSSFRASRDSSSSSSRATGLRQSATSGAPGSRPPRAST